MTISLKEYARLVQGVLVRKEETGPLSEALYTAVKALWSDKGVQVAFHRRDEFYLNDSAQ